MLISPNIDPISKQTHTHSALWCGRTIKETCVDEVASNELATRVFGT